MLGQRRVCLLDIVDVEFCFIALVQKTSHAFCFFNVKCLYHFYCVYIFLTVGVCVHVCVCSQVSVCKETLAFLLPSLGSGGITFLASQ